MSKVIIAAATRTPMGSFQGSLSDLQAPDLGAVVIRRVVEQTQLPVDDINEVIMGCVLPAGLKKALHDRRCVKPDCPIMWVQPPLIKSVVQV